MAAARHLRSESSESSSSSGSAYQLIQDHILSYPGSYEIPLRTMYTLNCAPRAQPSYGGSNSPSSAGSSPLTPQSPFADEKATQTFSENLMAQLSQLPSQPSSLPPSFITSFALRCFQPELVRVDFPQALTGLDYLKDLETRRRREVAAAMNRLGIDKSTLGTAEDLLSSHHPGVAQWIKTIEDKERKIDALYTQLYIGLRRWILVNELSLLPFNKHNCVAMLNTLYPPVVSTPPTSRLTPPILKKQRDGFFKYIRSVESSGPRVLQTLMQQGQAVGDENGWIAVTRTLGLYLQLANSIINDCADVTDVQSVSPRKDSTSSGSKQPRKVDSGVSFNMSEPLSSPHGSVADPTSPTEPSKSTASSGKPVEVARPKSRSGDREHERSRPRTPSAPKHPTALERIARGLKTIGRNRTDATEMISDDTPPPPPPEKEKSKTLRKMRSMGSINSSKADGAAARPQLAPAFDADEMRRQRTKYEATTTTSQRYGRNQSHEV